MIFTAIRCKPFPGDGRAGDPAVKTCAKGGLQGLSAYRRRTAATSLLATSATAVTRAGGGAQMRSLTERDVGTGAFRRRRHRGRAAALRLGAGLAIVAVSTLVPVRVAWSLPR